MSRKADRRTILKALATLPLVMTFGSAINYIRKQNELNELRQTELNKNLLKMISVPSSSSLSSSSSSSSSFVKGKSVKLDSAMFDSTHISQPFSVDIGNGKKVQGFGVKLSDGRIVAYPAHCPKRNSAVQLTHGNDIHDKAVPVLQCHDNVFDLKSGAVLEGPDRGDLRPFKVKNCGHKVCIIIEDNYLPEFTS
jgi:nitrite reductase/ring-hydroxylating ferredoxin subunit